MLTGYRNLLCPFLLGGGSSKVVFAKSCDHIRSRKLRFLSMKKCHFVNNMTIDDGVIARSKARDNSSTCPGLQVEQSLDQCIELAVYNSAKITGEFNVDDCNYRWYRSQ